MNEPRVWLKPDLVTRLKLMPLAEDGDDLAFAQPGDHLQFGSGGLDYLDNCIGTIVGQ